MDKGNVLKGYSFIRSREGGCQGSGCRPSNYFLTKYVQTINSSRQKSTLLKYAVSARADQHLCIQKGSFLGVLSKQIF